MSEKKALLVVSFGTSVAETRKKTIEALEAELSAAFPDRTFYRAWTSGVIRKKLLKTENMIVDSMDEALDRMAADGTTDLLVQPTHMLTGEEYMKVVNAVRANAGRFQKVSMGAPLLETPQDLQALADAMKAAFPDLKNDQMLVWMGHGSEQIKDNVYIRLNELFASEGPDNMIVGTVEYEPGFESVLDRIRERKPRQVLLAPMMVVAGDHALNDMSGDEPDSWKSRVAALGAEPVCILRGMGEYESVRAMYVDHARKAKAI